MASLFNLPARIIGILEANISPREIALGVCLGMFLGFTPLNGTTALLLAVFFFIFRINRMSTLLTLPVFKAAYLLGVSKLADGAGSYLLMKADFLTGFWAFVTNLPVVAYLDVNRTTVAGGLALSLVLSAPVYFAAKAAAAALLAKYSKAARNTAFSKWMKAAYHASNIIGPDAGSTIGNVKTVVKQTVIGRIKSAIIRPKARKASGIMKRLNLKGAAIAIAVLVIIQAGVGLVISPAVGALIIEGLNRTGGAKVTVEKINVWPLTLSFSMKELKVFDPRRPDRRILRAGSTSVRVSPVALLSKRLVFSSIGLSGAELDLEGAPDGSFNIQRLAAPKSAPQKAGVAPDLAELWREASAKRDWFGKAYSMIKGRFSKKAQAEAVAARAASGKVARVTQELPKGTLVAFKAPADAYLFEIRNLNIDGRVNIVPNNSQPVELRGARIGLKRIAFDPKNGPAFGGLAIRGELFRNNATAGRLELSFSKGENAAGRTAALRARLDGVDLDALRFVYEDSLPVRITRGKISLVSDTGISGNSIDSRNSITLTGQDIGPKAGGASVVGFIPIGPVCEALNRIDPLRLKFDITGTVEKPEFGGFQETLLALIKPYLADIGEQVKSKGLSALGQMLQKNLGGKGSQGSSSGGTDKDAVARQAVDSLKSLFGDKGGK